MAAANKKPEGVPPFISKLSDILSATDSTAESIRWGEAGDTVLVNDPIRFARDVLPRYFKHNNIRSFVRQLNIYGFQRCRQLAGQLSSDGTSHGELEFYQPNFLAGRKDLLRQCQRGTASQPQRPPVALPLTQHQHGDRNWALSGGMPPVAVGGGHDGCGGSVALDTQVQVQCDGSLALSQQMVRVQDSIAALDMQLKMQAHSLQSKVGLLVDLLNQPPAGPPPPAAKSSSSDGLKLSQPQPSSESHSRSSPLPPMMPLANVPTATLGGASLTPYYPPALSSLPLPPPFATLTAAHLQMHAVGYAAAALAAGSEPALYSHFPPLQYQVHASTAGASNSAAWGRGGQQ